MLNVNLKKTRKIEENKLFFHQVKVLDTMFSISYN